MSGLPFIIALVVPRLDDFSAKKKIVNICSFDALTSLFWSVLNSAR